MTEKHQTPEEVGEELRDIVVRLNDLLFYASDSGLEVEATVQVANAPEELTVRRLTRVTSTSVIKHY